MKILIFALLLIFSSACMAANTSVQYGVARWCKVGPALDHSANTRYAIQGYVSSYLSQVTDNWLLVMEAKNPAMMELIRDRENCAERKPLPWDGEYAGKHLTACVQVLRLTNSPVLREYTRGFINRLLALQADNGYLGIYPKQYEMTNTFPGGVLGSMAWDTWDHYFLMLGFLLWHEDTGDKRALNAAVKVGDLMCEHYLGKPGALAKGNSNEANLAPAHSLCLLYKATGTKRYLDLAQQIVDEDFPQCHDFVNRALKGEEFHTASYSGSRRWENLHSILALPELYYATGEEKYKEAFQQIWWSIAEFDRHNNGGFTSMEHACGNPYDVRAIETCCTIAWSALGVEMLRLTGNSIAADELELSYVNSIIGYQSRTGRWCAYNIPMEGMAVPCDGRPYPKDPSKYDNAALYCCTANAPRGLGLLSDWAVMSGQSNNEMVVNWYGPSTATTKLAGKTVKLTQETDYPRTGKILIKVGVSSPTKFTLKLRIPNWSKGSTGVSVNGKALPYKPKPGAYFPIGRTWKTGDIIRLELDMGLHLWMGEKESEGRASIYRGPVLLAYHRKPVSEAVTFHGTWKPFLRGRHLPYYELYGSNTPGDKLVYEFEGDYVAWQYNSLEFCGKAQVSIDGKVVDVVDQYAPVDDKDLFAYDRGAKNYFLSDRKDYRGLGPGRHCLEITVLSDRNPQSKDSYVSVREIVTGETDPELDAYSLLCKLLPSNNGGPNVAVQVRGVTGRPTTLVDFDTASEHGNPYITWFRMSGAAKAQFDRKNPLRTAVIK